MDSWIVRMVRAKCLRRVAAWALVLGAVALLGLGQRRYIQNFLMGPYDLGAAELDAIRDVSQTPRYFVRVTGSRTIATGLQRITIHRRRGVETGRSVSGAYYVLAVGDKFLVCSAAGSGKTFGGELSPLPPDLVLQLFSTPEMRAVRNRFYPYYLSDESFRLPGYIAIAGLVVLACFLVKQALPDWNNFRDPESHPVVKRVQGWGDPFGVAVAAQRESGSPLYKGRNGWSVTGQFLVQSTFFSFDLLRHSDLLWAYKKVTKHSAYFIPAGKTYEAVLVCYGGTAPVQSKEATTDEIMSFAAERTPWAIFGFSKELETHFKTNPGAFCDGVEQRRQEWAQREQRV